VGVSDDEPARWLSVDAEETIMDVIGVDLTPLVNRGKFVFVAQVGSPQKAVLELRDNSLPYGVAMDVLITGRLTKEQFESSVQDAHSFKFIPRN